MKKKIIWICALTAVFMVILPLLPILVAPMRNIITYPIYLFLPYLICPICSAVVGAIAGTEIKRLGYFAVLPAVVSLGAYVFFMDWEAALFFAGCYLTLGLIAMGIAGLIKVHQDAKKRNKRY